VRHAFDPFARSNRRAWLPANWPALRRQVLARDDYTCQRCGDHAFEVDHVQAGDDHSLDNLQSLCEPCHARKSGREGRAAR
jgi:5-methylcytosine-specific restriction endonuclease McrA